MTDDRSLERAARSWLEEGPTRAPDRPVEAALSRILMTPQERDLIPWRLPAMPSLIRVALGAAIAIAVLVGASTLISPPAPGPASPATPAPSTTTPSTPPASAPLLTPGPRPSGLGTVPPFRPASPLPPPTGAPLPADLLGRTYVVEPRSIDGSQELILTLRAADDPHCTALFEAGSTCFTILWEPNYPKRGSDPGARGAARIVADRLVLSFDVIPNDASCEGSVATYLVEDGGDRLVGVDTPACTFGGFTAT